MSVAKMQKLTLVAHKKDRRKILKVLAGLGTMEAVRSDELENTSRGQFLQQKESVEKKLAKLQFAFTFIGDCKKEAKSKEFSAIFGKDEAVKELSLGRENKLLDYEDLAEIVKDEYELFNTVEKMESLNAVMTDIKTEKGRLTNLFNTLSEYRGLDIPFSFLKDTQYTFITAGILGGDQLEEIKAGGLLPATVELFHSPAGKGQLIALCGHLDDKEETFKVLSQKEFIKCPFEYDTVAAAKLNDTGKQIAELDKKRQDLLSDAVACFPAAGQLKQLYDYYLIENAKLDVMGEGRDTAHAFVMDGWVPLAQAELTKQKIAALCPSAVISLRDPVEGETVPSYVENNKYVGAFGKNITATYGTPKYGQIDPNPFVAFFYFLFFGFMFSDAGYGLIMLAACAAILMIRKPVKNSGSFFLMFAMCGLSTVLWGTLFGSWFGLEAEQLASNGLGRFLLSMQVLDPMDSTEIIIIFGLALGLGVIQIMVGFILNAVNRWKTEKAQTIFNDLSWVVILFGLIVLVFGMILKVSVVNSIGMYLALAGVAMLLAGGAVGKKNPLKMIGGALKNLYGSINVFSDILSYARLFALSLTAGIIGLVFNTIGGILVDMIPYIGYVFMVAIILIGHTFNFAINALGVYVHDSRLQFVEFFGKFFAGDGKPFRPLGSQTKYIYLSDSLQSKEPKAKA